MSPVSSPSCDAVCSIVAMMHRLLPVLLGVLIALPAAASSFPTVLVEVTAIRSGSVPRGAQRVGFVRLHLVADCVDDAVIGAVRLKHQGKGSIHDIQRVYAVVNGVRASDAKTISTRDGHVTLRFRDFTVPACEEATVDIVADMSSDAASGGEHAFIVEDETSVDAGSHAVSLENKSDGTGTTRTAPSVSGSVSAEFLPLLKPVRYGQGRTVARLTLTAREKDQTAVSIRLTNDGKATDDDLQNLVLVNAKGEAVTAMATAMDGNGVTLTFKPGFRLKKNATTKLELRADVTASRKRTIGFTLDEPSDLLVTPAGR